MLQGQQRTLPHWIDDIHAQQTILMGFSKYRRSHTIIFFIILMNEKSASISVYLENKTTIIRLSPCVHITFWTVTFRFLWMLTSYVTGGCCHISVVSECYGSPLIYLYLLTEVDHCYLKPCVSILDKYKLQVKRHNAFSHVYFVNRMHRFWKYHHFWRRSFLVKLIMSSHMQRSKVRSKQCIDQYRACTWKEWRVLFKN